MRGGFGRRRERRYGAPPRQAFYASFGAHAVLAVLAILGNAVLRPVEMPQAVRVQLVAAAPEDAPIRLDPTPPEVAEEEYRPPTPEPTPDPVPQVETPTVEAETPVEREPEPEPARAEEVGEEVMNIRIAGDPSAYPEYYQNIIRQIQRYWRPPPGARDLRAEIYFLIHLDGRVSGMEWVARSGNAAFDLVAMRAVESADRAEAFGPLPADFPADALAVSFFFDPSGR